MDGRAIGRVLAGGLVQKGSRKGISPDKWYGPRSGFTVDWNMTKPRRTYNRVFGFQSVIVVRTSSSVPVNKPFLPSLR